MPRIVNDWWDDLDRDPSDEGVDFAQEYLGRELGHDPRCHAVQAVAVHFDKWIEKRKAGEQRIRK